MVLIVEWSYSGVVLKGELYSSYLDLGFTNCAVSSGIARTELFIHTWRKDFEKFSQVLLPKQGLLLKERISSL